MGTLPLTQLREKRWDTDWHTVEAKDNSERLTLDQRLPLLCGKNWEIGLDNDQDIGRDTGPQRPTLNTRASMPILPLQPLWEKNCGIGLLDAARDIAWDTVRDTEAQRSTLDLDVC